MYRPEGAAELSIWLHLVGFLCPPAVAFRFKDESPALLRSRHIDEERVARRLSVYN